MIVAVALAVGLAAAPAVAQDTPLPASIPLPDVAVRFETVATYLRAVEALLGETAQPRSLRRSRRRLTSAS